MRLFAFTAIVSIGCTTVDEPISDLYDISIDQENEIYSSNPYTDIGIVYQKLLSIYRLEKHITVDQIKPQLQHTIISNRLQIIEPNGADFSSKSTITSDTTTLSDIIDNSLLSPPAKDTLIIFTENLSDFNGQVPELALQYIHSFELDITSDLSLNNYDKQVILTFASLVKSSNTFPLNEEEDEDYQNDKDWDISIGNMIGYLTISLSQTPETMAEEILKNINGF